MEKYDTITHFLESGDFNYRVFDMGRKVTRLLNGNFKKIEEQQEAYPFPFQQKAWLALLFWPKSPDCSEAGKEPVIWFLQFPIDEMGFLKLDARDGFLISLLEQAGKNIQAKQSGGMAADELTESPYAFKPQPDRLALFHALAMKQLKQKPSQFYQHTRDYLSAKTGYEQWQFLGLQGIADVVVRLDRDENEALLAKAIGLMPEAPLESFCRALENVSSQGLLAEALISRLQQEIGHGETQNVQLGSMLIRACSGLQPEKLRREIILTVLASPSGKEIEVLAAISGRAWNDLRCRQMMEAFMVNMTDQNQTAFNAVLSDLMMIPGLREVVLEVMRNPQRPVELSDKLSEFMKVLKAPN